MTHVELGVATWDLTLIVVGYAALYGIGAAGLRPPDVQLVPLAFLAGWALIGVVFSLTILVGFDPSVPHVLIAACVLCLAGAAFHRRVPHFELLRPRAVPLWPGVSRVVFGRGRRSTARAVCVTGLALGGALLAIVGVATSDASFAQVLAAVGVLCVAGAVVARRRILDAVRGHALAAAAAGAAAAVLVLSATTAVIVAVKGTWPSEWDSFLLWGPRAEEIYFYHGLSTGPGGWGAVVHPEYPPLLAVNYAASCHFAGGFHPSVIPLQNTLLGIAFVGGMLALVDRFVPRWVSFPFFALLAATPGFIVRLQSLFADPALAYMVASAAVASLLWLATREAAWLPLAVLFLAAAALTKLEGLGDAALVASVVLAAALVRDGRAALPGLVLLLGPALVIPWRIWLSRHGLPTSSSDYRPAGLLHPLFLDHRLGRLTTAFAYLRHSIFDTGRWLLVGPLALGAVLVAARKATTCAIAATVWLALAYVGAAAVYWVGTLELSRYLGTSGDRVASILVIGAATVAPLLLGLSLERPGRRSP